MAGLGRLTRARADQIACFLAFFDVFAFAADLESLSKMAYGSTQEMDCIHPPTPLAIQLQWKCKASASQRKSIDDAGASHTPVIFRKPHP
jgi:hypothetical protein